MPKSVQNKTQPTRASVKNFLAGLNDDQQRIEAEKLVELMSSVTGHPPVMWGSSIIGFDQYHYQYQSGREGDMAAIGFSPRKSNFALYLVDGVNKYADLLNQLGPHKTGKACLYIKNLADIDQEILKKMLRASYEYTMSHKTNMHLAE